MCMMRVCVCDFPRVTNGFSSAVPVACGLTDRHACLCVHGDVVLTSRCGGVYAESMVCP